MSLFLGQELICSSKKVRLFNSTQKLWWRIHSSKERPDLALIYHDGASQTTPDSLLNEVTKDGVLGRVGHTRRNNE